MFADRVRTLRNEVTHQRLRGSFTGNRLKVEAYLEAFAKEARTALEDEGHQA